MPARFLLGPAGCGKTHRCLAEIRQALLAGGPTASPLLLLAPKQATFQLERQLLEDPQLQGWSRLQILSFERLAQQILLRSRPVELLSEEGRVMVLRALLRRHEPSLRIFRSAARLNGFAQELSGTLRELHRQQVGPTRLEETAERVTDRPTLGDKLRDLALLAREYQAWLRAHGVHDPDLLPDLAREQLSDASDPFQVEALWLDGFAQMTAQEISLLAAVIHRSRHATLAFCLETMPDADVPWRSPWAVVAETFRRVHASLAALPGPPPEVITLARDPARSRFARQPTLARLEASWHAPATAPGPEVDPGWQGVRLMACPTPEAEVEVIARAIRTAVHNGRRYRELAVLARSLETHDAILNRVFTRYGIPFFVDRREPLAHHPAAELTRAAVRLAVFRWQHDDWFGLLKTGLTPARAEYVDALENEALARGWTGDAWRSTCTATPRLPDPWAGDVRGLVQPFADLEARLGDSPSAHHLADALRRLWSDLDLEETLGVWSAGTDTSPPNRVHAAAWEQLQAWLDNLELGFGSEVLPLGEWLPVIEAGLASLTAGVIPPAQDQVLVGAIDRSRQPELHTAFVLGLNEGLFPAPPSRAGLLNESDREHLESQGCIFLPDRRREMGHERYLAYIACTRAREQLVLTWSQRNEEACAINPSPFIRRVQAVLPGLEVGNARDEQVHADATPVELGTRVRHVSELLPWLLARTSDTPLDEFAGDAPRREWLRGYRSGALSRQLSDVAVRALHGAEPELSVSALESLAACPFQFFIRHGLRARERPLFEVDPRHTGSLAHDLLARYHGQLRSQDLQWSDLEPVDAANRFRELARVHLASYADGLFAASHRSRWQAAGLIERTAACVAVLTRWARSCRFQPAHAELAFGRGQALPAWEIEVAGGTRMRVRGKADRVDLLTSGSSARFLVIDYKLTPPGVDDLLMTEGVDLQLAAYALALEAIPGWAGEAVEPQVAGMFYVALRGRPDRPRVRPAGGGGDEDLSSSHQHRGRFAESALEQLDPGAVSQPSGQFSFRVTRQGMLWRGGDGRPDPEFEGLLRRTRERIRELGGKLFSGCVEAAPYRHRARTGCDRCEVRTICRFDPWVDRFRRLGRPGLVAEATEAETAGDCA